MKRISMVLLGAVTLAVFATPSFAILRKDMQSARGTVTYINPARTEVTIKDSTSAKEVTFTGPTLSSSVTIGSAVIVLYKTGTTVAKTVRLIPARRSAALAANAAAASSTPRTMSSSSTDRMPKTTAPAQKSKW